MTQRDQNRKLRLRTHRNRHPHQQPRLPGGVHLCKRQRQRSRLQHLLHPEWQRHRSRSWEQASSNLSRFLKPRRQEPSSAKKSPNYAANCSACRAPFPNTTWVCRNCVREWCKILSVIMEPWRQLTPVCRSARRAAIPSSFNSLIMRRLI